MNNQNDQTIGIDGTIKPMENPVTPTGVLSSQPDNIMPVIDTGVPSSTEPAPVESTTPNFIKPIEVVPDDSDLLSSVPKPDIMISAPQDTSIDTDKLIEDYVNINYEKLSTKPINFSALFFGTSYMLYRKMYLEGGIALVLTYLIFYALLMVNPLVAPLIFLIVSILLFVTFNKLYITLSKKKIDKIKNRYKIMSVSELKKLCQKKGGTNIVVPIVVSILVPVIIGTAMTTIFPVDSEEIINKIKESLSNINFSSGDNGATPQGQQPSGQTAKTIESLTRNQNISLSEKIDMQYLTVFKPTDSNTTYMYDYVRYTTPDNENTYCKFNLSVIDGYEASTQLINDLAENYGASETISTLTTSSGITWNTLKFENDNEIVNIAASSNDGLVYLFTYKISKSADQSLASTWNNGVIQSINIK